MNYNKIENEIRKYMLLNHTLEDTKQVERIEKTLLIKLAIAVKNADLTAPPNFQRDKFAEGLISSAMKKTILDKHTDNYMVIAARYVVYIYFVN